MCDRLRRSPLVNTGNGAPQSPAGHPFINPLFPPAFLPPFHTALAVGTAQARPVFGAIDIGALRIHAVVTGVSLECGVLTPLCYRGSEIETESGVKTPHSKKQR